MKKKEIKFNVLIILFAAVLFVVVNVSYSQEIEATISESWMAPNADGSSWDSQGGDSVPASELSRDLQADMTILNTLKVDGKEYHAKEINHYFVVHRKTYNMDTNKICKLCKKPLLNIKPDPIAIRVGDPKDDKWIRVEDITDSNTNSNWKADPIIQWNVIDKNWEKENK